MQRLPPQRKPRYPKAPEAGEQLLPPPQGFVFLQSKKGISYLMFSVNFTFLCFFFFFKFTVLILNIRMPRTLQKPMFPATQPHLCVLTNLFLSLCQFIYVYKMCKSRGLHYAKKKMVRQKTEDPLITLHILFFFLQIFDFGKIKKNLGPASTQNMTPTSVSYLDL